MFTATRRRPSAAINAPEVAMSQLMQTEMTLPSVPRFDSPLHLWIVIWQRRLVYGEGVTP
jgi:hypothetical protein